MQTQLNTFYDVLQLLKKYGFIIYFDNKDDMLEMIEQEIQTLYRHKLITREEFLQSKLLINQRRMNRDE
ncbi:YqgQ family protein [Staphylococcus coagulans]|uniref:YqgQ family protein n=1 Tax=Staphylococcus coagulans TaxID=74706 RepID=UPI001BE999E5|nr:YqgQ family protein [Staphylococcus coagulans]MBT2829438.1 YqgQ family protein [Staphylococcus coagulans]MBT2858912.1 YqgQ family protein [Staphylococcus coagulans]MBU3872084.1 YqgQ family protein [Staphylococcus coagulans]UNB47494.1 YqgQ family protein [Staphylococcus coagulans]